MRVEHDDDLGCRTRGDLDWLVADAREGDDGGARALGRTGEGLEVAVPPRATLATMAVVDGALPAAPVRADLGEIMVHAFGLRLRSSWSLLLVAQAAATGERRGPA